MNDRQLIADLLSALEYHTEQTRPIEFSRVAIEAAREHLRKPAQPERPAVQGEPVAWASPNVIPLRGARDNHTAILTPFKCEANTVPLYTTPQFAAPERKPLTAEIVGLLYKDMTNDERTKAFTAENWFQAGLATGEAAHGITGEKPDAA